MWMASEELVCAAKTKHEAGERTCACAQVPVVQSGLELVLDERQGHMLGQIWVCG